MLTIAWASFLFLLAIPAQRAHPSESDPHAYLDQALDLLESLSMWTGRVDWISARKEAHEMSSGARETSDTYPAIRHVIEKLGEPHTMLLPPPKAQSAEQGPFDDEPHVIVSELGNGIGYIEIPGIMDTGEKAKRFAEEAHEMVRATDAKGLKAWVIDLRCNDGGNCYPMLAALGPVVGNVGPQKDVCDDFIHVGGTTGGARWSYQDGVVRDVADLNASEIKDLPGFPFFEMARVENPYNVKNAGNPLAVLIGRNTASSGEVIAIILKSLAKSRPVKLFGDATAGFTSGNSNNQLSDGAVLLITECGLVDGDNRIYVNEPVQPDETVEENATLEAAISWLQR